MTSVASGGAIGIGSTRPLYTWISASVVRQLAVLDVKTVVIEFTLQVRNTDAIGTHHEARWTDTLGAIVREHQTSAGVTDALVTNEDKAQLSWTSLTHPLTVGVVTRGTDTLLSLIEDETSARRTSWYRCTLHSSIALISSDTHTDHGPDRLRVQDCTLGISATGIRQVTRLGTVLVNTGQLAGTLTVRSTSQLDPGTTGAFTAFKSWRTFTVWLVANHCTLCHAHTGVLNGTG